MHIQLVKGIQSAGGVLDSYVLLKDGELENDSIVLEPSLYLLKVAKETLSLETVRANANDLKTFFESLEASNRDWRDITDNLMSGYIESTLQLKLGLKKTSIDRHCCSFKGFYNFATDYGLTEKHFEFTFNYKTESGSPTQSNSKRKYYYALHKKYINLPIFETILSNANETAGFLRDRDELVLFLGYHLGLRSAEVTNPLNLNISLIKNSLSKATNAKKMTISLDIIGKGGGKLRTVDLNATIIEKITNFLDGSRLQIPGDLLICSERGSALCKSHASRVFNKAKKRSLPTLKRKIQELETCDSTPYTISFPSIKNLSFHCLRHTFTTNLVSFCYENGIDPKAYIPNQLGHEDYCITKQYILFEANIYNRDILRSKLSQS
jgi:site-specific recombinase XerD